jgi:hypothetical protein
MTAKRLFLALRVLLSLGAAPLLAQEPTATPTAPVPATTAPAATAPAASEGASPVPATESWFSGSIDVGYTWRSDVGGSFDAYRSIVNLGSGPKLIGADFTLLDPKHRLFDEIRVRASGWGDDPYELFHLDAKKSKLYEFSADYRDIAYFDLLPSYADPLLARGVTLNEQSFDTRRHFGSYRLDLLPGNWIIPYLAFDRDSGSGAGVTTFVTDANTFPAPNTLHDTTNLYRGGVRIERRKFHVTLEEGGTTFSDAQSVYQAATPGSTNFGNVTTPIFGQTTQLSSLLANYGVRGTSIYSKALVTASVASWLDFYGQFLYSEPNTNVHYQQADTGNFLIQSQLLFYTSQQYLVSTAAKLPHTTGSFGAEMRPFRRLRITESWLTDRLHNSGSAMSSNFTTGTFAFSAAEMPALLASSLVTNYNQAEVIVFYDATSKFVLHGGYRYVWGDASDAVLPAAGLVSSDEARLRRNVGLGGVTFRPSQKLSLKAEAEVGSSGGAYFRTSLYDYEKVRAQARYQALKNLNFAADFMALINNNPAAGVKYAFRTQQESLSIFWSPGKVPGKLFDLEGTYTRSTVYSDIGYLDPGDLQAETSLYRDDAHIATALFNIKMPSKRARGGAKITAGGSLFISSGSRPTSYYQPLVKLLVPVGKKISWFAEWRYYDYGEVFDLYEGFRTHLVTTGLRFTPGPRSTP